VNAILLCPGPSLKNYQWRDADLIVGVNRAAVAFAVPVWLAGDYPLIQSAMNEVKGTPLLVTGMVAFDTLNQHKTPWRGPIETPIDAMLSYCPHAMQWCMFSATMALIYCAFKGATLIDVYGADMLGTADWDGTQAGKNRTEERWRCERAIWTNNAEWLNQRGITVERH
jgi:hypothetical protein